MHVCVRKQSSCILTTFNQFAQKWIVVTPLGTTFAPTPRIINFYSGFSLENMLISIISNFLHLVLGTLWNLSNVDIFSFADTRNLNILWQHMGQTSFLSSPTCSVNQCNILMVNLEACLEADRRQGDFFWTPNPFFGPAFLYPFILLISIIYEWAMFLTFPTFFF